MLMLFEQYLHEKSLEESRCVTINLSLVMQREKCVVCEKSRSPAFPCYEHHVFYVLDSAPHLNQKQNDHSPTTTSTSGFNFSLSSSTTSLSRGPVTERERSVHNARTESTQIAPSTSSTPAPRRLYHADPALSLQSVSEMALNVLRRRFADRLHVHEEQVHGPVFLYESHYTWTRLVDMRERERDHQNYHPVRCRLQLYSY